MAPVTIVTGASTGLGVAISVQAARAGHRVYATMRNTARRAALDAAVAEAGVTLEVLPLDVTDTASVTAAVDAVLQAEGRIDVLVNNAGAGFVRTTEQATETEIAGVMDVNFMGAVRCIKAVLPTMRTQRSGRVICISSVGGLVGQPFNEIYCAAKFALEGYVEGLASYVGPAFGLQFTLVEPGGIRSEFAASAMKQIEATGGIRDDEYRPILAQYMATSQARAAAGDSGVHQTTDEVAAVVMACLAAKTPPVRTRTSAWGEALCVFKTGADPDGRLQQAKVIETMLGGVPKP